MEYGYYSDRYPNYDDRWSLGSVMKFLSSEEAIVLGKENIFLDIKEQYEKLVDFGDSEKRWADLLSCWVIGTYFHRMFNSFPYVHLNGHMDSGKSKTLLLTMQLAFNGEMNVNSTPSYITRTIHDNNSSCGIDEAEGLHGGEDAITLVAMYNAGYKKGSYIGKSEGTSKQGWKPKRFDSYSPKMFGSIKNLLPTLSSRVIPVIMTRTSNKEIKNRDVDIYDPTFQEIRDQLYLMMMMSHNEVFEVYKNIKDEEIVGREWELWKPILTIARWIKEDLYLTLRNLAILTQDQKRVALAEDSTTPKLLEIILGLFKEGEDSKFFSNEEISKLVLDEYNNPYYEDFRWLADEKRRTIAPSRWIGGELRKAGVVEGHAVQKKVDGRNVRGHYLDKQVICRRLEAYRVL